MSYTLFLLLNVNHDPEDLLNYIGQRLERQDKTFFCLDESPDVYFSAEYLAEGSDRSICIDIPFGAEEAVMRSVLDFIAYMEEKLQVQVLDPQIGGLLKSAEAGQIIDKFRSLNLQALESYADGRHFLRLMEIRDQRKIMLEAARYSETTWQNYCSVALAYNRAGHAAEAQRLMEKALELDPQNPGILYALAVTCFNLRDYAACRENLQTSLALDADNPAALQLLHDCEEKLKS